MPLSPEQCHDHKHMHNRYNPMFNFDRGPNTATDHHNPYDYGFNSRKNFVHENRHCHIGDRIGHDPEAPDGFSAPIKKYYHDPENPAEPWYGFNEDVGVNDDSLDIGIGDEGLDFAWT